MTTFWPEPADRFDRVAIAEGAPGDTFIRGESIKATTELAEWVCKQAGGKGVFVF